VLLLSVGPGSNTVLVNWLPGLPEPLIVTLGARLPTVTVSVSLLVPPSSSVTVSVTVYRPLSA
jgi:hypothetical protein